MSSSPSSSSPLFSRREIITCVTILVLLILIFLTTSNTDSYYQSLFSSTTTSNSPASSSSSSTEQQQQRQNSKTSTNENSAPSLGVQFPDEIPAAASSSSSSDFSTTTNFENSNPGGGNKNTNSNKNNQKPHVVNEPRKYSSSSPRRPFRFHIYKLPHQYVEGALEALKQTWHVSICNRGKKKSNYTMLDWRHAHSLFTADVFITRYMRLHPQHTENPNEADAFIIPMMSHLYNCAGKMQYQIDILSMIYSKYQKNYKEMEQRDHYLFWWRWGMHYGSVQKFWRRVTRYFPNVNLISFDLLEIMGRNQFQDFSLALKPKFDRNLLNIIMPYPDFSPPLMNHNRMLKENKFSLDEIHTRERDVFFYFAGTSTIGGVRRWIKFNCDKINKGGNKKTIPQLSFSSSSSSKLMNDCVFVDFATSVTDLTRLGVPTSYPQAMMDSVFCGHAAGDALSSRRPTSAILAGCIPVMICDLCLYAWEGHIDYTAFSVFVPESEVIAGNLIPILKKIYANSTHMKMLRDNLNLVRDHFVYHEGAPKEGDALDMLAKELERRGLLMRQYRRWYQMNSGGLSSDLKDYPVEPPSSIKKYVKRDPVSGKLDEGDARAFPNKPLPV